MVGQSGEADPEKHSEGLPAEIINCHTNRNCGCLLIVVGTRLFFCFREKIKDHFPKKVVLLEQGTGVEPAQSAWEAEILPIN